MGVFGQISIVDAAFWICVGTAIALQILQTSNTMRRLSLAAVNLGFLYWLLGNNLWVALTLVLLCWFFTLLLRRPGIVRTAGGLLSASLLGTLFFDYRFNSALQQSMTPLAAIGFAYVFLRAIDMLRCCWETPQYVSPVRCLNHLMPFHMLAAGPILGWQEYTDKDHLASLTPEAALKATERIATGLFKKYVLAFALQHIFLTGFRTSGLDFFVEVNVFYIWLYLDFSGYSDVAVGVGTLIGAHTPENFNRPYLARNMIDFWDRWHITLSQFLRRNLFIPLELSLLRKSQGRAPVAISVFVFVVTFLASAVWHSTARGFLLWGLIHTVGVSAVVIYREILKRRLGKKRFKAYQKHPVIRVIAVVVTFEYVAWALVPIII